jgi:hypothetical protein
MIKSKVGLEAEFLLHNAKGDVIVPPSNWDRDGFPLLGEIRGKEADNVPDVMANFERRRFEILNILHKGHSISFAEIFRVPLKIYREANRAMAGQKKELNKIQNIYGTNIEDFSDQIIEKGKIQGINVSCGLHVHFSCEEKVEVEVKTPKLEEVILPFSMKSDNATLFSAAAYLYRKEGYDTRETLVARASKLNYPTIRWIVEEMDKAFFDRFAPKKDARTKYRQPGFYELKPYGFEYRSLPASDKTFASMNEVVAKAFALLKEASTGAAPSKDDDDED